MLARTSRTLSAAALALAAAACTTDRLASPAPHAISPEVRRALETAGPRQGPVMVFQATSGPSRAPMVARPGARGGTLATLAPERPRFDFAEQDLAFIANPSGGRAMGGVDSTFAGEFTFYCYDYSTAQWTQLLNVTVNDVSQQSFAGTGGHGTAHTGTKPVGHWKPRTGNSTADGRFPSTYTSGVASGDEELDLTFTAHDASSPCAGLQTTNFFYNAVRYRGLQLLTAQGGLTISAISSNHTSIYYATPGAIASAYRAQVFYDSMTNHTDHLRVNAASLIYGGINDVTNNWAPPHRTHRIGTDVDFDGNADTQRVWDRVSLAATRGGGFRRCEVHNRNHVHCYARLY
jgi:hypothetical protein